MNPRRPSRGPGGPSRGPGGSQGGGDDSPAQTNLGMLLQQALRQAQQTAATEQSELTVEPEEIVAAVDDLVTKACANCWNARTYKDEAGRMMARCTQDLWVRPQFTVEELNANRVRRWYADCPAYDDEE